MFHELLTKISNLGEGNNLRDAYIYAVFCGFNTLLGMTALDNASY